MCKRKIPSIPFGVALFFSRSAESPETVRNANRSEHDCKMCNSECTEFSKENEPDESIIYEFSQNFN